MRWMGVLFSLFLLMTYGLLFNTIQANSVVWAVKYAWGIPEIYTGIFLAGTLLLLITKGLRDIARFMQRVVPVVAFAWVAMSIGIGIDNVTRLPQVIVEIIQSAFGWQEAAAGAMGYTLSQALTSGFSEVCILMKSVWGLHPMPQPRHRRLTPPPRALFRWLAWWLIPLWCAPPAHLF